MFCKNKLLKYLFPEFKSYKLDNKLYIDSKFFESYSIRMLNDLGYDNVYIKDKDEKDIKIVNYRPNRKRKLVETNEYFNVNEYGFWEEENKYILTRTISDEEFIKKNNLKHTEFNKKVI